jgi:phosphonate degradation associated HDIG domain protein
MVFLDGTEGGIMSGSPSIVEKICELFATKGHAAYVGEPVSQLEHALQAAHYAEQDGASDALVTAALVHDIGHLVHKLPEDAADRGIDTRHEMLGAAWLARYCGAEVTEPIRLHVPAKRYLCATDPHYLGQLSPASVQSLGLQGGPFSAAEIAQFQRNPHYQDAVALRRWDDRAKIPGLQVPPLDHYRPRLARTLKDETPD